MKENLVVENQASEQEDSSSMTLLEILAIQAMMNPSSAQEAEEEFEWSGKLEDL